MSFVIFGYFAVFFTTVSFLPQAIKTLKTRNVEGLSMKKIVNISKDLKKRGFQFFGPTITYSFMQAAGLINDHTINFAFK